MEKVKSGIFENLKNICIENIKSIKDTRRQRSDMKYSFQDIILGAFSRFYFQNSSWLKFQTNMQTKSGKNNAKTLVTTHLSKTGTKASFLKTFFNSSITFRPFFLTVEI